MKGPRQIAVLVFLLILAASGGSRADGSRDFVARPKVGATTLSLPSHLTWTASPQEEGKVLVALSLVVDIDRVLRNIKSVSAAAMNRSKPCGDTIEVLGAHGKLIDATTLAYDLHFRYAKRLCTGALHFEMPADVACTANILISAAGAVLTADIQALRPDAPPCAVDGIAPSAFKAISSKIFKPQSIDLAEHLPREFGSATINVRSVVLELPPASAKIRMEGDSVMLVSQFRTFERTAASYARH